MALTALFVCTGNICRSPLAEVMATARFPAANFSSAGTIAIPGNTASANSVLVAAERGLDLSRHAATLLTAAPQPDLVFGMEQEHLIAARAAFPDMARGTIRLLDHPSAIVDPYGREIDAYRVAADHIDRALANLDLVPATA